jgi:hypothetical protein
VADNPLAQQVEKLEEKQLAADYMLGEMVSYMMLDPGTVDKDHYKWVMRNFEKYNRM